jgi:hypothetical protein
MANYKICSGGALATTVISIDEILPRNNILTYWGDCDITTDYVTLEFTSTVPADDPIRIFYTWLSRECYDYQCLLDAPTTINNAFITLGAGELSVEKEVKIYEYQCCTGDAVTQDQQQPAVER